MSNLRTIFPQASEVKTSVQRIRDSTTSESIDKNHEGHAIWQDLRIPAFGLMLVAAICGVASLINVAMMWRGNDANLILAVIHASAAGLIGYGALNMLSKRSLRWAQFAAIYGMLPVHFGAGVGFVFGIWALILLHKYGQWRDFGKRTSETPINITKVLDQAESIVILLKNEGTAIYNMIEGFSGTGGMGIDVANSQQVPPRPWSAFPNTRWQPHKSLRRWSTDKRRSC